jgi:protein-tyrosine phosphatase
MEVLNIAKIKDGLFIGDKTVGTNLSILMQFKITHLVNTAGNQIPLTFGNAGIKYLTLNWVENPTSNVIYIKDDIVKKIITFIDNSLQRGSGIMVISVKGHNRACVAIILYLMKKYNWSLNKCKEYLALKKNDIFIKKSFLNQLISYEEKLNKKSNNSLINDWKTYNIKDGDELLMNNTYLNEKQLTKKNYLISVKKNEFNETNKKNENNEIIKIKKHIDWADRVNPYNYEKKALILKCEISKDLFFQKNINPITNHLKMQPLKSCIKSSITTKTNNLHLDNMKKTDNKQTIIALDKKMEKEEKSHMKTQILRNKYYLGNKPTSKRKYTYDDKDNDRYDIKENLLDNFNQIISDEKKIIKNLFKDDIIKKNKNENEKNNNNIKEDKKKILTISDNLDFDNKEFNNNIHFYSSQKQINNFMNDNKYSLYFHNSYSNTNNNNNSNKKRGTSARKDKNNTHKLSQNKKYYLGKPNSKDNKKNKENEKDMNIIPKITHNNTYQTLNYEYNLNFHNNRMLIRSLINEKEIKTNINNYTNSLGDNMNYITNKNKKRPANSLELKNNKININDSNRIYKPKNANIFDKYNSYALHSSEPVKINSNNNVRYRLGQSHEKKINSIKLFDNLNDCDEMSKGLNIVDTIIYKHSRPLSAKKSYSTNKNINYYFNTNKSQNNNNIFAQQKRAPSPLVQDFHLIKNIGHYNKYQNNRYNSAKPKNNGGNDKKLFKK